MLMKYPMNVNENMLAGNADTNYPDVDKFTSRLL